MGDDAGKGFADLLAEVDGGMAPRRPVPRVGQQVSGSVVALSDSSVFVDLGTKAEAVLELSELSPDRPEVKVGDRIVAYVASVSAGQVVLRMRLGRGEDSAEIEHAFAHGVPVEGKVSGVNKGGVEVQLGGTRAFCPISQLDRQRVDDAAAWLGKTLEFLVRQYEAGRGAGPPNVVLSRRALLERQRAAQAAETLAALEVGATVQGVVTRTKPFGAFVDLGGIEGLIHVSELGYGRVGNVADVLSVGDQVEARVLKIEPSEQAGRPNRISLSLKALAGDPFEAARGALTKGTTQEGTVVRMEPFGAFVQLTGGLEGLVHVSELVADRRVSHPREVLSVGQRVKVCVLELDPERRRVALSIKQVAAQAEADQAAAYREVPKQSLGTFADLMKQKLGK